MTAAASHMNTVSFLPTELTFTSDLLPLYGFFSHEIRANTAMGMVIPRYVIISP